MDSRYNLPLSNQICQKEKSWPECGERERERESGQNIYFHIASAKIYKREIERVHVHI